MPESLHPLHEGEQGCEMSAGRILEPTPLSEWLRQPLDLSELAGLDQPAQLRPPAVLDAYLDIAFDVEDFEAFADALVTDDLWCGHLSDGTTRVGRFAEFAALRLSREIVRNFFPPVFSAACDHREMTSEGEGFLAWDPRAVLPTPAGRRLRKALCSGELELCGPHALLRATAGYLPELSPVGTAINLPPRALFLDGGRPGITLTTVGSPSASLCHRPVRIALRAFGRVVVANVVAPVRPLIRLFPSSWRSFVRRGVLSLFPETESSSRDLVDVSRHLGFRPYLLSGKDV